MENAAVRTWVIFVQSWLVAANLAELEAPDGTETDEVFFVVAENEDGTSYRHFRTFRSWDEAEALASRVFAASPVWQGAENNPHWAYFRTAYASAAYARNAPRLEAETELAEREPELGPDGAYCSLPDVMKVALSYPAIWAEGA